MDLWVKYITWYNCTKGVGITNLLFEGILPPTLLVWMILLPNLLLCCQCLQSACACLDRIEFFKGFYLLLSHALSLSLSALCLPLSLSLSCPSSPSLSPLSPSLSSSSPSQPYVSPILSFSLSLYIYNISIFFSFSDARISLFNL